MSEADIEKKIGLSLDELIAQQKAKQANKPKPKPKAAAAGGKKKGGQQRVSGVGGACGDVCWGDGWVRSDGAPSSSEQAHMCLPVSSVCIGWAMPA